MEDAEIVALQNSLEEAQKQLIDVTAERDSLLEELAQVKDQNDSLMTENAETKKLNFTLARQLDTKPRKTADQALVEMFGKKGVTDEYKSDLYNRK